MTRYPKGGRGSQWTVNELKSIPPDWRGDTLSDGNSLSGEVRVSSIGAVSVRFKSAFKWEGKVAWYQCGSWPSVALKDIRERRDSARQLLKSGVNPVDQSKADRIEAQARVEASIAESERRKAADLPFRQMFEAWLADGVSRDDGNAALRRTFEKDVLPAIGSQPVRAITETDLLEVLRSIGRVRGAGRTAQRMLSEMRQLYRWSMKRRPWRDLLPLGNPADLIDKKQVVVEGYVDGVRERVLSAAEILELRDRLDQAREAYASIPAGQKCEGARPMKRESELCLWILLSTLCRVGETLKAEWKDVDRQAGEWRIPAENTKTKVELLVYLSPFALHQFNQLHTLTGHTRWCFPARPEGRSRDGAEPPSTHLYEKSVSKQVGDRQIQFMSRSGPLRGRRNDNSLVLAAGQNGEWTPHDLRRTGGTMMQALGVPLEVIDRCQNHVLPGSKVRRHYLHHDYATEKCDAWARLGRKLAEILGTSAERPTSTEESNEASVYTVDRTRADAGAFAWLEQQTNCDAGSNLKAATRSPPDAYAP